MSKQICCIRGCTNKSRKNCGLDSNVKFYKFPESMYNCAWKVAKRAKWIDAVKEYVKNDPNGWQPNRNTKICSNHFVNNAKSEHPLDPAYIPSIFPRKEIEISPEQKDQSKNACNVNQLINNNATEVNQNPEKEIYTFNQLEECFICLKENKIMIRLNQSLSKSQELTVGQVLQNLNFLTISDTSTCRQVLCLICIANIQTCNELKMKCRQLETKVATNAGGMWPEVSPSIFFSTSNSTTKLTNTYENNNVGKVNDTEDIAKDLTTMVIPTKINFIIVKSESDLLPVGKEIELVSDANFRKCAPQNKKTPKKSFVCSICQKRHVIDAMNMSGNSYICYDCNGLFFNVHQNALIHKDKTYFFCDLCDRSFTELASLQTHTVTHLGEKTYVCNVCHKTRKSLKSLLYHKKNHSGDRRYTCDLCSESFTAFRYLRKHKIMHID